MTQPFKVKSFLSEANHYSCHLYLTLTLSRTVGWLSSCLARWIWRTFPWIPRLVRCNWKVVRTDSCFAAPLCNERRRIFLSVDSRVLLRLQLATPWTTWSSSGWRTVRCRCQTGSRCPSLSWGKKRSWDTAPNTTTLVRGHTHTPHMYYPTP